MFPTENEFVGWLQTLNQWSSPRLRLGIGDDAALVEARCGHDIILTTDMSIEGVHFTCRLHPPPSVGHRALARSLSDIAAMGGTPRYALISCALSRRTTRAWVEDFYRGFAALAKRFGVALIGGDTALVAGRTMVDVIVAGEVPRGKALRRSGARPGDQIYVSGRLGLSALGLQLLRGAARPSQSPRAGPWPALRRLGVLKPLWGADRLASGWPAIRRSPTLQSSGDGGLWATGSHAPTRSTAAEAVRVHLYPEPRCALGRYLSERRLASALMDISDGLSIDLARLCEASGVGACLSAERIPGPRLEDRQKSLALALHGGEDYQLLFTVPPSKVTQIPSRFRGLPLHPIGEIQSRRGLRWIGMDGRVRALKPAGWDYFRAERRPPL